MAALPVAATILLPYRTDPTLNLCGSRKVAVTIPPLTVIALAEARPTDHPMEACWTVEGVGDTVMQNICAPANK
jgi:hypothetical protein